MVVKFIYHFTSNEFHVIYKIINYKKKTQNQNAETELRWNRPEV